MNFPQSLTTRETLNYYDGASMQKVDYKHLSPHISYCIAYLNDKQIIIKLVEDVHKVDFIDHQKIGSNDVVIFPRSVRDQTLRSVDLSRAQVSLGGKK